MGNHRFRLSHVMPNVWFYKLRDMGIGRNRTNGMMMNKRLLSNAPRKMRSPESAIRRSFELAQKGGQTFRYNPGFNLQYPRYQGEITSTTKTSFNKSNSSKKNSNSTVIDSSISAGCNCRTSVVSKKSKEENSVEDSVVSRKYKEEKLLDVPKRKNVMKMQKPSKHVLQYGFNKVAGLPSPVHEDEDEEDNDINSSFLLENSGYVVSEKPCSCKACRDAISLRFEPSPIKTSYSLSQYQDKENMNNTNSTSNLKKNANSTSNLKNIANVTRSLKDGISSEKLPPKAMKISQRTKNSHAKSKKNSKKQSPISSGFAVVKRSYDPQKDFRDSMVDMIIQNDICYYKDLLGLLECYLSLNSEEYHDIIVEVFQQVWLDFMEVP